MIDPDRAVCGLATVFDVQGLDGTPPWSAEAFRGFLELETAVPLLVNHEAALSLVRGPDYVVNRMVESVGMVRRFAMVAAPVPGLLCLGAVDRGQLGDELLGEVRTGLESRLGWRSWGFSAGSRVVSYGGAIREAWPFEVSLTTDPAFADARVLAVGPDALRVWELLAG